MSQSLDRPVGVRNGEGISHAVTVFNKGRFLARVLESVGAEAAATGGEIVILDDGSTDDSLAIAREFAATAKVPVRVIAQRNAGVMAATNRVLAACACPFVRLVDGDDLLVPGSGEALRAALVALRADVAFGRAGTWTPGVPIAMARIAAAPATSVAPAPLPATRLADPLREAIRSQLFVPSAVMVRASALRAALPLDETFRSGQDFLLSLRLARHSSVAASAQVVCLMGQGDDGRISGSKARMYADCTRILVREWAGWPAAYRRYAVRRSAMRAYLYASRHLDVGLPRLAALRALALGLHAPLQARAGMLAFVGRTYDQALAAPAEYP
jgi:glycosyltransferase involved in cell wall biosynthesis